MLQEDWDWLSTPPFPPPPVTETEGGGGASRGGVDRSSVKVEAPPRRRAPLLAPLAPLPFRPTMPEPRQCCPTYKQ